MIYCFGFLVLLSTSKLEVALMFARITANMMKSISLLCFFSLVQLHNATFERGTILLSFMMQTSLRLCVMDALTIWIRLHICVEAHSCIRSYSLFQMYQYNLVSLHNVTTSSIMPDISKELSSIFPSADACQLQSVTDVTVNCTWLAKCDPRDIWFDYRMAMRNFFVQFDGIEVEVGRAVDLFLRFEREYWLRQDTLRNWEQSSRLTRFQFLACVSPTAPRSYTIADRTYSFKKRVRFS